MIPEEVIQAWNAKADALPGLEDLRLPSPSGLAPLLAGQRRDPVMVASLQLLASRFPDELPIDGGAARCRRLDSAFYDRYKKQTAQRPRGVMALEACWLATDEALHYVSPQINQSTRWQWSNISIAAGRRTRRDVQVRVTSDLFAMDVGMASAAAQNLMAIAAWVNRPQHMTGTPKVASASSMPRTWEPKSSGDSVYAMPGTCDSCGYRWRIEFTLAEGNAWLTLAKQAGSDFYNHDRPCPSCGTMKRHGWDIVSIMSRPPTEIRRAHEPGSSLTTVTYDHPTAALVCDRCETDNMLDAPTCRGCGLRIDWLLSGPVGAVAQALGYVAPPPGAPTGHPRNRL